MPTLATGNKGAPDSRPKSGPRLTADRARCEAGFSLVELLAVMAILSLMVGLVVLNLPEARTQADERTEAMAAQLSRFLDDGVVLGEMRALGADTDALVLYRHDGLAWQRAGDLPWPDDARIRIDRRIDRAAQRVELTDIAAPLFLFEPYGVVPDFVVSLQAREAAYLLQPDARGRIVRTVER